MFWAILTCLSWACSAVAGQRASLAAGSLRANLLRLVLATALLAAAAFLFQASPFSLHASLWLFASGLAGFGVGDVALYLALPRIGSRLTVLITFCLAPVIAGWGEWIWYRETLSLREWFWVAFILTGVSLALRPSSPAQSRHGSPMAGVAAAVVAAAGQGFGALLTRAANHAAAMENLAIPALHQAFQRVLAGLVFALLLNLVLRSQPARAQPLLAPLPLRAWGWLLAATLGGPVIGLTFYQEALRHHSSALVLAVVAMTPIFTIPLAFFIEHDRPGPLALAGSALACAGMAFLATS